MIRGPGPAVTEAITSLILQQRHHRQEGKPSGKRHFLQIAALKSNYSVVLFVIDGISVWLSFTRRAPTMPTAALCSSAALDFYGQLVTAEPPVCPASDSGLILFFNSLQVRLRDMITACRR